MKRITLKYYYSQKRPTDQGETLDGLYTSIVKGVAKIHIYDKLPIEHKLEVEIHEFLHHLEDKYDLEERRLTRLRKPMYNHIKKLL